MFVPENNAVVGGKFQLESPLGEGGMGAVWRARHTLLDVEVAVKFMAATMLWSDDARKRFEREAKTSMLLKHPHVVQVLDYGVEDGAPYFVMELLQGEDLSERLRRFGRFSPEETLGVLLPVSKALRRAHEMGLVHRDLKPANIFLAQSGSEEIVKVLDFGIAKQTILKESQKQLTQTGQLLGTPLYMSPEQVGGKDIDLRSDLFTLGVITYELLTGRVPFQDIRGMGPLLAAIAGQPCPPPSSIVPELGSDMDRFFERAMAKEPNARFQTAIEFAEAFALLVPARPKDMTTPVDKPVSADSDELAFAPTAIPTKGKNIPPDARNWEKIAATPTLAVAKERPEAPTVRESDVPANRQPDGALKNTQVSPGVRDEDRTAPARTAANGDREESRGPTWSRTRKGVLSVIVLLALAGVTYAMLLDRALHLDPVSVGSRSIVVLGQGAQSLCKHLDVMRMDREPAVVCHDRTFKDPGETIRSKAIAANHSVLVFVEGNGSARIHPLGKLANHDTLSHGLPLVDLTRQGASEALAPLLHELARAADEGLEKSIVPNETRLRCGLSVQNDELGIAVLTMVLRLFAANCKSLPEDVEALRPRCRGDECNLLDMLDRRSARRSSPQHGALLTLRTEGRDACARGDAEGASRARDRLNALDLPLARLVATQIAACEVARAGAGADANLKALASRDVPECAESLCAIALGERAGLWASAGDWVQAERDYSKAWDISRENEHLFGRIEARLHRHRTIAASELAQTTKEQLADLRNMDAEQAIRAKLLRWIAEKRDGNRVFIESAERELVAEYDKLKMGASVYKRETPDDSERGLLCPPSAHECPVYDQLSLPKDENSSRQFRDELKKAVLPMD